MTKVIIFRISSLDFLKLPNSIIGYDFKDYLIKFFIENSTLEKWVFQARDAHNLIPNDHLRLFWEPVVLLISTMCIMVSKKVIIVFFFGMNPSRVLK